jgi:hypothetical protein
LIHPIKAERRKAMSNGEDEVSSRRKFFRDAAAGMAGMVAVASASCSQTESPVSEAPNAEPKRHAMTREEYLEYVACFNRKDFEAVASYFTPDITVEYYDNATGPKVTPRTLYGPQQFIENYKALTSTVKEVLELRDYMSTDDRVFAELYTEFHPLKDTAPSQGRQLWKVGEPVLSTNWVMYDMVDGKMKRIRIAHWRLHDPKTAKYAG